MALQAQLVFPLKDTLSPQTIRLDATPTAGDNLLIQWSASEPFVLEEYLITPQFSTDPAQTWLTMTEPLTVAGDCKSVRLSRTPLSGESELYRLQITNSHIEPSEIELKRLLEGKTLLGYDFREGNEFEIPFFRGDWTYERDTANNRVLLTFNYSHLEGEDGETDERQAFHDEVELVFTDALTANISKRRVLYSRRDAARIVLSQEDTLAQNLADIVHEPDLIPAVEDDGAPQVIPDEFIGLRITRNPSGNASTLDDLAEGQYVGSGSFAASNSQDLYHYLLSSFEMEDIAAGGQYFESYRNLQEDSLGSGNTLDIIYNTAEKVQTGNALTVRTPPTIRGWWDYITEINEAGDEPFLVANDISFYYNVFGVFNYENYAENFRIIYRESEDVNASTPEEYEQIIQRNEGELVYSVDVSGIKRLYPEVSSNGIVFNPDAFPVAQSIIKERLKYIKMGEGDRKLQALVESGEVDLIFERKPFTPDDPATSQIEGPDFDAFFQDVVIDEIEFFTPETLTRGANPLSQEKPISFSDNNGTEQDAVDTVLASDPDPQLYLKVDQATVFSVGQIIRITNNDSQRDLDFEVLGVFISPTASSPFRNGYLQLRPIVDYTPQPGDDLRLGSPGQGDAKVILVDSPLAPSGSKLRVQDGTNTSRGDDDLPGEVEYFRLDRQNAYLVIHYDGIPLSEKRRTLLLTFDSYHSGSYESTFWVNDVAIETRTGNFDTDYAVAPNPSEFYSMLDNSRGDTTFGSKLLNINYITKINTGGEFDFYTEDLDSTGTGEPRRYEALGLTGHWRYERLSANTARIYLTDEEGIFFDDDADEFRTEFHLEFIDPVNAAYTIYQYIPDESARPIFVHEGTINLDEDILQMGYAPTAAQMEELLLLLDDVSALNFEYLWDFKEAGPRPGDGQIANLVTSEVPEMAFYFTGSTVQYDFLNVDFSKLRAFSIKPNGLTISQNNVPFTIFNIPDNIADTTSLDSLLEATIGNRGFGLITVNSVNSGSSASITVTGTQDQYVLDLNFFTEEGGGTFSAGKTLGSNPPSITFDIPATQVGDLTYARISYETSQGTQEALIDLRRRVTGDVVANAIRSSAQLAALAFNSNDPNNNVFYDSLTEQLTLIGGSGVLSYNLEACEVVKLNTLSPVEDSQSFTYVTEDYAPEEGIGAKYTTHTDDFVNGTWEILPPGRDTITVEMRYYFNNYEETNTFSYRESLPFRFFDTNYFEFDQRIIISNAVSESFSVIDFSDGDMREVMTSELIRKLVLQNQTE